MQDSLKLNTVCRSKNMFQIFSDSFGNGQPIPPVFTCDGENKSPALRWENPPEGTVSFVLSVFDPDAPRGGFVHWLLYDIPYKRNEIPEKQPGKEMLPGIGTQGMTGFKRAGYGGPCPPKGKHRYFFTLYALDTLLNLPSKKTLPEILSAMEGHILDKAALMGTYEKKAADSL